ncbi:MAG: hypothetical protein IKZ87_04725 [Actinomycetaceae bacterium]|nr:hypothetical protein [Actinomycetaceae bacterium]
MNWRLVIALVAIAIGALFVTAGLRSRSKPQPLSNVEPSVAALAAKASAAQPAAAPAEPAASVPVVTLPKPVPQAVAATIPAAEPQVPQEMSVDARFAQLEERLNTALRELHTSRADVRALEQRIAKLEGELKQANARVQELSEKTAKVVDKPEIVAKKEAPAPQKPAQERSDAPAAVAAPDKKVKQARKVAAAKRRRTAKTTAGESAASAEVVNASSRHQRTPDGQGALLAVDMWDGKPSAVIGTGIPGDRRVRVLQPGEQLAGVALVKADARRGSATFSTGTGVFTMFVDE